MPLDDVTGWKDFAAYGWTIFLLFFGIQRKTNLILHGRISEVKDNQAAHALSAAKEYVTKIEHNDMIKEIRVGFNRIMDKLDTKVDK